MDVFLYHYTMDLQKSNLALILCPVYGKLSPGDNMKKQIQGSILLLIGTIIWGTAFVAQSVGMDYIGPFTFQTGRSVLALIALWPVIWLMDRQKDGGQTFKAKWTDKKLWKTGLPCGLALFVASGLQQVGLVYTDARKAGFITAMYIVLVPVLGLLFKQKVTGRVWFSVGLAVVGRYLLSWMGVSQINFGDLMLMICAAAYAVQITLIDRLAQDLDGLRLNFVQFLVVAVLSGIVTMLTETVRWSDIAACAVPLLYTGVMSSAVAYSLQILGQQHLDSAPASLIMSLESVIAALSGWAILGEKMTGTELMGSALVFAAVVLSQMPAKKVPS